MTTIPQNEPGADITDEQPVRPEKRQQKPGDSVQKPHEGDTAAHGEQPRDAEI